MKKATQQQTKEHNRNLVLKTIFDRESISRAEIARLTSLTRTTVSEIVNGLLDEGLVKEVGVGRSQGGKSPILLSLLEDSRYLIGLDLNHSQLRGAVINLRGKICARVALPVNDRNGEQALAQVYEILDQLTAKPCRPLVGIGVGTAGLVNTRLGVVVNAVNLDWADLPLARLLQDRYKMPVYILNDSQAAALGEYTYGGAHPSDGNLVVINVRHGIGSGIIINGHLFHGDGGGAGEIGHIVVEQKNGQPCRCGNRGCLETVASAQALVRQTQDLFGNHLDSNFLVKEQIDLETIEQAFKAGDPLIRQMVLETGRYLGIAIAGLIGTLNIHKIVLSGDMTCFGQPWLAAIQESISQYALPGLVKETQVEIGQLGGNSILLGASAVLANNYWLLFNHPVQ